MGNAVQSHLSSPVQHGIFHYPQCPMSILSSFTVGYDVQMGWDIPSGTIPNPHCPSHPHVILDALSCPHLLWKIIIFSSREDYNQVHI